MRNTRNNPSHKRQGKGKHFQAHTVFIDSGIIQRNIARFIAKWKRQGAVQIIPQRGHYVPQEYNLQTVAFYTGFDTVIIEPSKSNSNE